MPTEIKILLPKQSKQMLDNSSKLLKSEQEEGNCRVLIENAVKGRVSTAFKRGEAFFKTKHILGKALQDNNFNSNVHKYTKFLRRMNSRTRSKFVLKAKL